MFAKTIQHDLDKLQRVNEGRHHDPFSILGCHSENSLNSIRVLLPNAVSATIQDNQQLLERIPGTNVFSATGDFKDLPEHYQIAWKDFSGKVHLQYDPYSFGPQLSDYDLHLFAEGKHYEAWNMLGANHQTINNISGILFSVWAPNAERVSVVGPFNHWNGHRYPMRSRGHTGIWEIFIPELESEYYKFEIRSRSHGRVFLKTDPYARQYELRPGTASIIDCSQEYLWEDDTWLDQRGKTDPLHQPLSIYELHLGSWKQSQNGDFLNYRDIAHKLAAYVLDLGFNAVELMPITEHPFDGSWGYQTTGYFAPSSRYGNINDFKYFVNYMHANNIAVILDWVPGHFPKDDFALAQFDGSPLYEHADPKIAEHRDWGTLIFNYGRKEVNNFLISSALFWLKVFHLDGLRVDAVASMLYLDYSRQEGEWIPNIYGGNENLEAINFLRELNKATHQECKGSLMIAEESTAWPQVTRPTWLGGLGFTMKWNMGWMHDSLKYLQHDPVHRHYHHDNLTFGLLYAFTENFVLPFSHDEVVHGKGPMIYKLPGDEWQQFANLRLLYTYMFTYPGKKLLFMGSEFGQTTEWNHEQALDWHLTQYPIHQGVQAVLRDLNRLYQTHKPLYQYDFNDQGFEWIDCHDSSQSVLSFIRKSDHDFCVVVLNFTPVPRRHYRIGVPDEGLYQEIHNSDSKYYSGSNLGNGFAIQSENIPWMGRAHSIEICLPPLAGVIFHRKNTTEHSLLIKK